MRVVTSDMQEAIAVVSRVYCPHDAKVLESNRGIDAVLESSGAARRQVVTLRYAAPVKIDAGTFENLLLFMKCVDGAAEATQGRHSVQWGKGCPVNLVEIKAIFDVLSSKPTVLATVQARGP